ncbi:hypothetical protein COOONC_00162 [Cooperia oncophora]
MVGLYSDRLPDVDWFLNIAPSPCSPTLVLPKKVHFPASAPGVQWTKKSFGFSRKRQRRSSQQSQPVVDAAAGEIDYHSTNMKPPLSYAQLIMDAMAERQVEKITLSEIYEYAARRYAYYRSSKGPWKVSYNYLITCNFLSP